MFARSSSDTGSAPQMLVAFGICDVDYQLPFLGGVCGGSWAAPPSPTPAWTQVVACSHHLLIFPDAVAIDHLQVRVGIYQLQSLRLESLVHRVNDALVPQGLWPDVCWAARHRYGTWKDQCHDPSQRHLLSESSTSCEQSQQHRQ